MAKGDLILTESQVQAVERKKQDDIAAGEIETAHPGYLGSQDTFYMGTIKGVGRIYQQTFIDTYAKVGFAKLYTTLQEFYQVTFRKKIYRDTETLQFDLDLWLEEYNHARTHQGKMCCGRAPMETLEDGKRLWEEKKIA